MSLFPDFLKMGKSLQSAAVHWNALVTHSLLGNGLLQKLKHSSEIFETLNICVVGLDKVRVYLESHINAFVSTLQANFVSGYYIWMLYLPMRIYVSNDSI